MTQSQRISVGPDDERIALTQWGVADSDKPPALLVHGTGFVGEVWDEVASVLASRRTIFHRARTARSPPTPSAPLGG